MKKSSIDNLEICVGGATNRDCMIAGGLVLGALATALWGPALIITGGATWAGCFH